MDIRHSIKNCIFKIIPRFPIHTNCLLTFYHNWLSIQVVLVFIMDMFGYYLVLIWTVDLIKTLWTSMKSSSNDGNSPGGTMSRYSTPQGSLHIVSWTVTCLPLRSTIKQNGYLAMNLKGRLIRCPVFTYMEVSGDIVSQRQSNWSPDNITFRLVYKVDVDHN